MADCVNKQLVEWIQKGDNDKVLKLMSDVGRDVIHHTSSVRYVLGYPEWCLPVSLFYQLRTLNGVSLSVSLTSSVH